MALAGNTAKYTLPDELNETDSFILVLDVVATAGETIKGAFSTSAYVIDNVRNAVAGLNIAD